jgi:23S rRNA pseudouridine1911/1915/1917 synthase
MNATFSFTVKSKQVNSHLLACLLPAIPYLQPEQWQALLLGVKGEIKIDGVIIRDDVLLLTGQVVSYTIDDYQEAEVDDAWTYIWSNNDIAVVHKPPNLPVNRTTRNVYNTLIQLLRRESPWPDAHLLHRLDLETSGLILIAQNNTMARQYQSKLGHLIRRKIYRAVVAGKPTWETKDFTCNLATLDESEGGSAIRSQMHVMPEGKGKESRTLFKVLETKIKEGMSYSMIECELLTGRKHQIRAHLAHLGHAIVGDKIYSNNGEFYLKRLDKTLSKADHEKLLTPHHLLHAYEIHLFNLWPLELGRGGVMQPKIQDIILRDDDFPESWRVFGLGLQ